ncbi:uncharacterized protein LOC128986643 isoform X2 [Macrosteles quadrilineatus]|uniref:uncharacterized protein LOC128986643 isoform X2 n=1 Tax=Macrosteles quadrilineatus TaxID=74068 RepID=UPI0023E2484C|nr:uncharacterized protein LOC128986643 isoform X2 [Macrosteles quadrilineatus]
MNVSQWLLFVIMIGYFHYSLQNTASIQKACSTVVHSLTDRMKKSLSTKGNISSFVKGVCTQKKCFKLNLNPINKNWNVQAIWCSTKSYRLSKGNQIRHITYSMYCWKAAKTNLYGSSYKIGIYGFDADLLLEVDAGPVDCNEDNVSYYIGVANTNKIFIIWNNKCVVYEVGDIMDPAREERCSRFLEHDSWIKQWPETSITGNYKLQILQ